MTGPMLSTTCPSCGKLDMPPEAFRLMVCEQRRGLSYYSFLCIRCGQETVKPAAAETRNLLRGAGVVVEHWAIPAEAMEKHSGPAITYDDVLNFALLMAHLETPLTALVAQALIVPKPYDPRKPR